jgi:ketosteroid isomerase-like protein
MSRKLRMVEEGYARFNAHDVDWVLGHLARDVIWEDAADVPDTRVYRGVDEVRSFLDSFGRHWETLRFEPVELLEGRGVVMARCRLIGRGRASGAEVDAEVIHLFTIKRRKVRAIRTFFDRETAAEEAGIQLSAG